MAGDQAGTSVAAAGDVNGDGFDDLIVGAPYGDDGGSRRRRGLCPLWRRLRRLPTPVTTTGNGAAEILIGGAGDDELVGGGGADVIRAGAGDDIIGVSDLTFAASTAAPAPTRSASTAPACRLDLTDRACRR